MDFIICIYLMLVLSLAVSPSLICFVIVMNVSIIAVFYALMKIRGEKRNYRVLLSTDTSTCSTIKVFTICFIVVVIGSLMYWFAYFPGSFNLDALGQWEQAHGYLGLSDWHPIVSTMIIKLSAMICDSFTFCILLQIIAFSISIALLLSTLSHYGASKIIIVAIAIYIAINPAIALNTIALSKDVQFTVLAVLMTDVLIRIYFTDGMWLLSTWRCLYLAFITTLICLVRHNGILFSLPAIGLTVLLNRNIRKRTLYVAVISALCFLVVKGPVQTVLGVAPHEDPIGEAVGIPMAIMANALVTDPDSLPEEVHVFLNRIADDETWDEHYCLGEWDSCKWTFPGATIIKESNVLVLLNYTLKTIVACPEAAYQSFRANTNIVWQPITMEDFWIPEIYIEENDYGIETKPVGIFSSIAALLTRLSQILPVSMLCWNTGVQIIIILLAHLFTSLGKDNSASLLYAPLLVYDMGTMLLLAGPNQRYFYCNAVLFLPITLSVLIGRGGKCQSGL